MGAHYRIQIRERIDPHWAEWFEGMTLTYAGEEGTTLEGVVIDQAALYGLISRLRDLGLTLVSVQPDADTPGARERLG